MATSAMVVFVIILVLIGVIIGVVWMSLRKPNGSINLIPMTPTAPNLNHPPSDIDVGETEGIFIFPGQKWPDPQSAGCPPATKKYPKSGWISSHCDYGTHPELVMGGRMGCFDWSPGQKNKISKDTCWHQATKPHPSYGRA